MTPVAAHDHDAHSPLQRYGASLVGVLLLVFIVWGFFRVPDYPAPQWPDDWEPSGTQWDARWQPIAPNAQASTLVLERGVPGTTRLVVRSDIRQWSLYDYVEDAIVAQAGDDRTVGSLALAAGMIVYTPCPEGKFHIRHAWADPITLETTSISGQFAAPMPDPVTLAGMARLDDGGFALLTLDRIGGPLGTLTWVRFDASGQEVAREEYKSQPASVPWTPEPAEDPVAFVQGANTLMEAEQGIDLYTGAWVRHPRVTRHLPKTLSWPAARIDAPRGYSRAVDSAVGMELDCAFDVFHVAPIVLTGIAPPTSNWRDEALAKLALLRHKAWQVVYSEELLRTRELQARQVAEVHLRAAWDTGGSDRVIRGDLPLSLRIAAHRDRGPLSTSEGPTPDTPASATVAEIETWAQLQAIRGPAAGEVIVAQVLTDLPTRLGMPHGLLRIGLVAKEAEKVEWLGFVPLESEVPIPVDPRMHLAVCRMGDELILSTQPALFEQLPGPLWYTRIPCPQALMGLPEGEVRP